MATLDLTVPTSWGALTQDQLAFLLRAIAAVNRANVNCRFRSADDFAAQSAAQVAVYCLFRWNGMRVITPYAGSWLVAREGHEFVVSQEDISAAVSFLSWASGLPEVPVRLERIDGADAVPAELDENFTFDDWLACEALWQNYQATRSEQSLKLMAAILYHKEDIRLSEPEVLSIFYWWAGIKAYCNRLYPKFFQPAPVAPAAEPNPDSIRRNMDAQIRALTKGDITKESLILSMPVHRALTELDALAREYEELNRKYPSK